MPRNQINIVLTTVCLSIAYSVSQRPLILHAEPLLRDTINNDSITRDTLAIEEVVVNKRSDALTNFEAKKAYHKEIYSLGDDNNMIIFGLGIGVNIQKVYNHFSRRGKGSRRLQRQFEREYEEDLVNEIWDPLIAEYTTLQGDSLAKFNLYSKPTLDFLTQCSYYERVAYVLEQLKNYRDSAAIIHERFDLSYPAHTTQHSSLKEE